MASDLDISYSNIQFLTGRLRELTNSSEAIDAADEFLREAKEVPEVKYTQVDLPPKKYTLATVTVALEEQMQRFLNNVLDLGKKEALSTLSGNFAQAASQLNLQEDDNEDSDEVDELSLEQPLTNNIISSNSNNTSSFPTSSSSATSNVSSTSLNNQSSVKVTIIPRSEEKNKKKSLNNIPNFNNSTFNAADFGGTPSSLFTTLDSQQEQKVTDVLNKGKEENDTFSDLSSDSNTLNNSNSISNNFLYPFSSSNIPSSSSTTSTFNSAPQPNLNNVENDNGLTIHIIGSSSSKKNNTPTNAEKMAKNSIFNSIPNKTTWETARSVCKQFATDNHLAINEAPNKVLTITGPNQIDPITVQQNKDENSPVSISTADATIGNTKAMLVELAKSIAAEYAKTGEAEIEIETKNPLLAQELDTLLKAALGENAKVTVTIKRPQEAPGLNH